MTPEQKYILEAVARVRDEKREKRRIPTFCLGNEFIPPTRTRTFKDGRRNPQGIGIRGTRPNREDG